MRIVNSQILSTIDNGIVVKPSNIENAGMGLFAQRDFKRGEYITLYDGEIVTRKEAWTRQALTHMASREGIVVDGLKVPLVGRGGGSFANSALSSGCANAEIVANLGRLIVRAKKDIAFDDEILVFYGRRGFTIACAEKK